MTAHILDVPKDQRHTDLSLAKALDVDKATVCRWRLKGVSLPSGERLRLKYHRIGKRAYIHPDDARNFLDRQTEAEESARTSSASAARRTAHPHQRASTRAAQAEAEANALGI